MGLFKKDRSSTAHDAIDYVEHQMHTFNLAYSDLVCVITDTEATMIAAGRMFAECSAINGGKTSWHGCIDHLLELVTGIAFKDIPESQGAMAAS